MNATYLANRRLGVRDLCSLSWPVWPIRPRGWTGFARRHLSRNPHALHAEGFWRFLSFAWAGRHHAADQMVRCKQRIELRLFGLWTDSFHQCGFYCVLATLRYCQSSISIALSRRLFRGGNSCVDFVVPAWNGDRVLCLSFRGSEATEESLKAKQGFS